ncbi:hypothetical protein OPT61_g10184 [Boeremia exigua]|uniref:Uncharacterized protein n=1 Tax=Boeremia exigua TaxID=749465 RepID=A0ACC2HRG8_9PLEO|nr:hypothetical protein OPT61_g10184 [Boeremia exigua]
MKSLTPRFKPTRSANYLCFALPVRSPTPTRVAGQADGPRHEIQVPSMGFISTANRNSKAPRAQAFREQPLAGSDTRLKSHVAELYESSAERGRSRLVEPGSTAEIS